MLSVEKDRLDPWGETFIGNYERLHKEFGIERMDAILPRFKRPSLHIRRGIDFGTGTSGGSSTPSTTTSPSRS